MDFHINHLSYHISFSNHFTSTRHKYLCFTHKLYTTTLNFRGPCRISITATHQAPSPPTAPAHQPPPTHQPPRPTNQKYTTKNVGWDSYFCLYICLSVCLSVCVSRFSNLHWLVSWSVPPPSPCPWTLEQLVFYLSSSRHLWNLLRLRLRLCSKMEHRNYTNPSIGKSD